MKDSTKRLPDPLSSTKKTALLLYGLALVLRLAAVIAGGDLGISLDDMFQYDMLGRSLASGEGFRWYEPDELRLVFDQLESHTGRDFSGVDLPEDPRGIRTSHRAPLYPFFLSLIYRLNGLTGRFFAVRLVQAFLVATLAPLAYLLAKALSAQERWARLAGVILSCWPLLVALPLALATENLFHPLVATATLLLLRNDGERNGRWILLAGVLFGLAALTRSVITVFPVLAALYLWYHGKPRAALFLILPVFVLTLPWAVRNTMLHDRLTFVESSLGYNLYLGYHPGATGTFQFGPSLDLITVLDDAARDRLGRQLAWGFIQADPDRVPLLMVHKLGHFWGLEDRAFMYLYSNGLFGAWPLVLIVAALVLLSLPLMVTLPLAILGWTTAPRDRAWQLLTLLFAGYIGVHLLILAESRFHLALAPMLAALGAMGLSRWPRLRDQWRAGNPMIRRQLLLVALLVALAVFNWATEVAVEWDRYSALLAENGWQARLDY